MADIENILTEKLESAKAERTNLRESIEGLENKIKQNLALIDKTPRESDAELQAKMQKLEHTHGTTTQSKADERQFMFDMDKLRQKRKYLATYTKVKAEVDELKSRKAALSKEIREKEVVIDELQIGLRKLKVSNKLGCSTADLLEQSYPIEEDGNIARVIGKGGSNLRNIENEYGVNIDISRNGTELSIMGKVANIDAAYQAISTILQTSTEEFPITDETAICLLMDNKALLNDFQERHDVRLDVSKTKNLCKITGNFRSVATVMEEIKTLQSTRSDITIDANHISFIIGKGGANIRQIEDDNTVSIQLIKERNVIEIYGLKQNVKVATNKIKELIDFNKEVEEIIKIEKHVLLGCLIGANGGAIRQVSKENTVKIDTEGNKEDILQTIRIKGIRTKVSAAKQQIVGLIEKFIGSTHRLEVDDDFIPILLGKGGVGIKAIRDKYPSVNIDIDKNIINIQSEDDVLRTQAKDEIEELAMKNHTLTMDMTEPCIIQLKSVKGNALREEIMNKLNLKLILEKVGTTVKLRGHRDDVMKGKRLLDDFQSNFTVVRVHIHEEDYPIILKGSGSGNTNSNSNGNSGNNNDDAGNNNESSGNNNRNNNNSTAAPSLVNKLSKKYDVEIFTLRKELLVQIKGHPASVEAAKQELEGYLQGDVRYGSQLVTLDLLVYSAIIGKAGANIKKMEEEYKVNFDILKSRNLLRIYNGTTEQLIAAKNGVENFIENSRVTETITPSPTYNFTQVPLLRKFVLDTYQVEIVEEKKKLNLRGIYRNVMDSKEYVQNQVNDTSICTIPLLSQHIEVIKKSLTKPECKQVLERYGVKLEYNNTSKALELKGPTVSVYNSKLDVYRFIQSQLSNTQFTVLVAAKAYFVESFNKDNVLKKLQECNVTVFVDRSVNCLLVSTIDSNNNNNKAIHFATILFEESVNHWKLLNDYVEFEEYMIPMIVGKNGATIIALNKETNANIEINRTLFRLEFKCNTPEEAVNTKKILAEKIRKIRAEHWETTIPSEFYGNLIGKQGSHINRLRTESGANIDIDSKTGHVKVHGPEEKVQKAREMLTEFIHNEEKNKVITKTIFVPPASFPAIIGQKGATVRDIQDKSNAKLDIDRANKKCILKGSAEAIEKASNLIQEILEREGFVAPKITASSGGATAADNHADDDSSHDSSGKALDSKPSFRIIPGATPEMIQRMKEQAMSKAALKRHRKREKLKNLVSSSHDDGHASSGGHGLNRRSIGDSNNDDDNNDNSEDEEESDDEEEEQEEPTTQLPTTTTRVSTPPPAVAENNNKSTSTSKVIGSGVGVIGPAANANSNSANKQQKSSLGYSSFDQTSVGTIKISNFEIPIIASNAGHNTTETISSGVISVTSANTNGNSSNNNSKITIEKTSSTDHSNSLPIPPHPIAPIAPPKAPTITTSSSNNNVIGSNKASSSTTAATHNNSGKVLSAGETDGSRQLFSLLLGETNVPPATPAVSTGGNIYVSGGNAVQRGGSSISSQNHGSAGSIGSGHTSTSNHISNNATSSAIASNNSILNSAIPTFNYASLSSTTMYNNSNNNDSLKVNANALNNKALNVPPGLSPRSLLIQQQQQQHPHPQGYSQFSPTSYQSNNNNNNNIDFSQRYNNTTAKGANSSNSNSSMFSFDSQHINNYTNNITASSGTYTSTTSSITSGYQQQSSVIGAKSSTYAPSNNASLLSSDPLLTKYSAVGSSNTTNYNYATTSSTNHVIGSNYQYSGSNGNNNNVIGNNHSVNNVTGSSNNSTSNNNNTNNYYKSKSGFSVRL